MTQVKLLNEFTELAEHHATLRHVQVDSQRAITEGRLRWTSAYLTLGVRVLKCKRIYAQASAIEKPDVVLYLRSPASSIRVAFRTVLNPFDPM